jgi:membrane fusion protein (multidrug efflux system)
MTGFSRTFAQLMADQFRSTIWTLAGAVLVLGMWLCWAVRARISLYEVSTQARIELDSSTYPIESPVQGRVVQCRLQVGQQVHLGDVLVEIDAMPDELGRNQERLHEQDLGPEITRLRSQIAAEQMARTEEQKTSQLRAQEAQGRVREAETAAQYSERESERMRKLHAEKLLSDRDLEKAEGETAKPRAAMVTVESAARQIPQELATRDRERDIHLQQLQEEIAKLEAERDTTKAAIERLGYEIERRRLRAPVDGRIGEAAILRGVGAKRSFRRWVAAPDARLGRGAGNLD